MKIQIDEERKAAVVRRLQGLFRDDFDEDLSEFRAAQIVDLLMKTLGPAVYNQAVQDVRAHLQTRLDDLDGEVFADIETER